jgi:hydroxymethylbilane synthase
MASPLIIGTRGSQLALTQTRMVAQAIQTANPGLSVDIRVMKTTGDRTTDAPLVSFGGEGVFVRELERALLAGEIDLAVHSLKDLPTALPDGLAIAAVPERADVRDALISREGSRLDGLPAGARIGTSSPRRRAQLLAYRPDLRCADIRGNIDTRLRKLAESGEFDAIVLACAGLDRMGWGDRIHERIPCAVCLPAVGQAALAVEARAADDRVIAPASKITHAPTERAVTAERAFLQAAGGGCHTPAGAWGRMDGPALVLDGVLAAPDGAWAVRDAVAGPPERAETLGEALARRILERVPGTA